MTEQRAPKGGEWGAVIDALHALGNMITVRSHYTEGHPAINQADDNATAVLTKVLEFIPDLVIALVDGEFIVCERPLPDMRARLHALADAMVRHEIECFVFQRGVTRQECGLLGAGLALLAEEKGRIREQLQSELMHVLLRFVVRAGDGAAGAGAATSFFVPPVHDTLVGVARALASESPIDKLGLLAVANQIVLACTARTAMITQRSWTRSMEDEATHAANVAIMTASLALDAGYAQRICIDVTAAALLHDIGHLFLPEEMRGVPEPLLEERARAVFRNHTFAGAAMLLGAGCSPLWIAAAFEHHRGVDAGGYPALESKSGPHELVRFIALANYFDSKRTRLQGRADEPEDALRGAMALEERYFGEGMVRRFLKVLGVYPPGTTVELSSTEPAIVTRANGSDPWRPQVKILRGPGAGRILELREVSAVEGRHRLSIVRAMPPPLLVLADAVIVAPVSIMPPIEEEVFVEHKEAAPVEVAAKDAHDRARAQLGGMDAILDALLTLPTDALVSAMPPAPSNMPRAMPMSIPVIAPPRPISSVPPTGTRSAPVPAMPMPATMPMARGMPAAPMPPPRAMPAAPIPMPVVPLMPSVPPRHAPPRITNAPPASSAASSFRPPVPPLVMTRPPPVVSRPPQPGPQPAHHAQQQQQAQQQQAQQQQAQNPQDVERALLQRLGPTTAVPVLIADVTKLNLDHRVAFVLRFLDGMSTVEDILDASGLPRVDVLRVFDYLVTNRVIQLR